MANFRLAKTTCRKPFRTTGLSLAHVGMSREPACGSHEGLFVPTALNTRPPRFPSLLMSLCRRQAISEEPLGGICSGNKMAKINANQA